MTTDQAKITEPVALDEIDRRLIDRLRGDPRVTFSHLADDVQLSSVAIANRVRRLRDSGVLVIGAILEPSALDGGIAAGVLIEVTGPALPAARAIAELNDVTFIALATGSKDIHCEVRCGGDVIDVLDKIREVPGVDRLDVLTYLEITKELTNPPRDGVQSHQLDPVDWRLIELLQSDGRASFAHLAKQVEMSPSTVAARINRLLDSAVIVITTRVAEWAIGPHVNGCFICRAGADSDGVARKVAALDAVEFVAVTTGSCDVIATTVVETRHDLLELANQVRAIDGIEHLETVEYLGIVKEDYRHVTNASPFLWSTPRGDESVRNSQQA